MSPQQLENILVELDKKGATKEEIQSVYNDYTAAMKNQGSQQPAAQKQEPGFWQGTAQAIAKPFLTAASTVIGGGEAVAGLFSDKPVEQVNAEIAQGTDFGWLSDGKVKPIGYQMYEYDALSDQQKKQMGVEGVVSTAGRTMGTAAGTAAEMASYALMPAKISGGFWKAAKAAAPTSGMFAAGTGLQKYGETGDMKEGLWQGAKDFVGSSAGFGLFQTAGNVFTHFGSRLLQSEAMRKSGQWLNDFAEKAWSTMPDGFKEKTGILGDNAKLAYDALKSEFESKWKTVADVATDAAAPKLADPQGAIFRFERGVSQSMGNEFRASTKLYNTVKADQTKVAADGFESTNRALGRMKDPRTMSGAELAESLRGKTVNPEITNFAMDTKDAIKQGLTLKQVLELNARALELLPKASKEDATTLREIAASLFGDAKKTLEKQGDTELVRTWDNAYLQWERAGTTYRSGLLNYIKGSGSVDNIVDKTLGKSMSREEERIVLGAIKDNPQEVQDMFISSVLSKAKAAASKDESASIIRKFLDTWGNGSGEVLKNVSTQERAAIMESLKKANGGVAQDSFLTAQQKLMLDDLAHLYEGNFEDFYRGMRTATGLNQEIAEDLYDTQGRLKVSEMISSGRMDEIKNVFTQMKDDPKFSKAIAVLPDNEKQAFGIAITKDLYDANRPFIAVNPDGSYGVARESAEAFIKTWESIAGADGVAGNRSLYELYSKEQIDAIEKAYSIAKDVIGSGSSTSINKADFMPLVHGILSAGYFIQGFYAGGAHHAVNAFRVRGQESRAFYDAINNLISDGMLEKNKSIKFGDILQEIQGRGQMTSQALEAGTTGNN